MHGARVPTIRNRLTKAFSILERIAVERLIKGDPQYGKTTEQALIQRELLDLELQDLDEQMEKICRMSAFFRD